MTPRGVSGGVRGTNDKLSGRRFLETDFLNERKKLCVCDVAQEERNFLLGVKARHTKSDSISAFSLFCVFSSPSRNPGNGDSRFSAVNSHFSIFQHFFHFSFFFLSAHYF